MKKAMVLMALMLVGCKSPQPVEPVADPVATTKAGIIDVTQKLAKDLVRYSDVLDLNQPLLVATPVMVEDMQSTDNLAAQLQQGLMAGMQQVGFHLVDLNVADSVRVTPQGDFLLSRDWQKVPSNIAVDQVLVSTVSLARNGIVINSRIVTLTGNKVISTAELYVPQQALPDYLLPSQLVVSKASLLYRNSATGEAKVHPVGESK
ncbi:hypothetical protein KDN34_05100 [Shewanella yunxiaonensis]|uniref:FlgO domain-containing protein n=1 Tax=Shewanella yunxiaonensis TaxID=2829809 RepID=A0ABX7YX25_9GAMM|nr:FlgO family outer membrane protein [Shewanella yunxiaonensis]QUN06829.1 hypothetical protein KDN34_05100 [Shewanella yunxiaonensis]